MTIKEIDKQIQELRNKRYELEIKEIEQFKEEAKSNIGRCFIIDGAQYVKVIGIPREEHKITGCSINKYQYPAMYLGSRFVPFYEDTLFSGAWDVGHDILHEYEEITSEEFNAEFKKRLSKFTDRVYNVGIGDN